MKRFLSLIVLSALSLSLMAQSGSFSLPQKPDTLRILAVGNSFSDDGTEYLPSLLEAAGIHNVIIARLYIGGCSLERHCKQYESDGKDYQYYKSGSDNRWNVKMGTTITYGLEDEPWDIITIQQASGYSGQYETIGPWADRLIKIIRQTCSNPNATIVWHQTWAYAKNSTHQHFAFYGNDQKTMYDAIQSCVDRVCSEQDIHTVIPCGPAVQIARGTSLNNIGEVPQDCKVCDLTRDGFHMSLQYGRYLVACTWFETLIRPTLGKSVKGNSCTLTDTEHRISAKDAKLCQKIAAKAVKEYANK